MGKSGEVGKLAKIGEKVTKSGEKLEKVVKSREKWQKVAKSGYVRLYMGKWEK